ncbi:Uncharacterized protein RNJ44_03804 [Nakaseomyces bracarensis]|uniref:AAA+ ATPase domain-containing protein n=1 Tax=Nakaseomyces bracarensis TaxID=273131 RepID=A0ABR4NY32_9SACH
MIGPDKFLIPSGLSVEQALKLLYSIARDQYKNLRLELDRCLETRNKNELPRVHKALDSLLAYVNDGLKRIEKSFKINEGAAASGMNSPVKRSLEDFQLLGYDIRIARRDAQKVINDVTKEDSGRSLTKLWRRNSRRFKTEELEDAAAIKEAEKIMMTRAKIEEDRKEQEQMKEFELEQQRKRLMELRVRQQVDLEVAGKLEEEELKRKELEQLEREREEIAAREKALRDQEIARQEELERQARERERELREQERLRREVQRQIEIHKEQERKEREILESKIRAEKEQQLQREKEKLKEMAEKERLRVQAIKEKERENAKNNLKTTNKKPLPQINTATDKPVEKPIERLERSGARRSVDIGSANREPEHYRSKSPVYLDGIGKAAQTAWSQFQPEGKERKKLVRSASSMAKKVNSSAPKVHTITPSRKKYEYKKPVINRAHIIGPRKAQITPTNSSRDEFAKAIRRSKSQSVPSSPILADQPIRKSNGTNTNSTKKQPKEKASTPTYADERIQHVMDTLQGVDQSACEHILDDILIVDEKVYWDDIAGLRTAKNSLKEAVVYPFLRPDLFKGLREPIRGMLLFGPPGTGKTLIAKAVATESNSVFFSISASSLLSKYLGESEKLVRALFYLAKRLAPSIIFIDEIDSLLTARSDNENESSRRIKTEVLIQWSALSNAIAQNDHSDGVSDNRVLVLAATNLPWAIDEAARRRFSRRVYIPLPDYETRLLHITKLLSRQPNNLSIPDYEEIAKLTEGYSGSDLTGLAKEAAMEPIREIGDNLMDVDNEKIRGVTFNDFKNALLTMKKSVSPQSLKQFEEWAIEYGSTGV